MPALMERETQDRRDIDAWWNDRNLCCGANGSGRLHLVAKA